jgi:hypothetical protein
MKKVHPVFDNDGTLWAEQPMYFRLLFTLDCLKALAPRHPEWKDKEPFALVKIPQRLGEALLAAVNPVFGIYTLMIAA